MEVARQLIVGGRLRDAIERLSALIRERPADPAIRSLLFECLVFDGNRERALRQVDAIGSGSPAAEAGAAFYRNLLHAEERRQSARKGAAEPDTLLAAPAFLATHLRALALLDAGQAAESRSCVERALGERRAVKGSVDGKEFGDLCDADDLLSPFFELAVLDRYFWVPWEQIRRIELDPLRTTRDLLWLSVRVELEGGRMLGGVTYPLYPGSSDNSDEEVKLGRTTDWFDCGAGLMRGAGRKQLFIDEDEVPLAGLQEIVLHPPE